MQVDDAQQYLARYEKQLEAMNQVLKGAKDSLMKPPTIKKTKLGDQQALEVEMSIPLPKGTEGLPNMEQVMDRLLGTGGKMKTLVVAADKQNIVFGFNSSKDAVAKFVDASKSSPLGLANQSDVKTTAALLPAAARWIVYFSPKGLVGMVGRIVTAVVPQAGVVPKVPEFPETPPIGVASLVFPQEVDIAVAVPAEVLEGIGKFVQRIQQGENPNVP
jgi:hypothetical protein